MSLSPFNHIPVPRAFRQQIREHTFFRLGQKALITGEQKKGEMLTAIEVDEILGKLRERLEQLGFFDL